MRLPWLPNLSNFFPLTQTIILDRVFHSARGRIPLGLYVCGVLLNRIMQGG